MKANEIFYERKKNLAIKLVFELVLVHLNVLKMNQKETQTQKSSEESFAMN